MDPHPGLETANYSTDRTYDRKVTQAEAFKQGGPSLASPRAAFTAAIGVAVMAASAVLAVVAPAAVSPAVAIAAARALLVV